MRTTPILKWILPAFLPLMIQAQAPMGPGLEKRTWSNAQLFREVSEIIMPTAPAGYSAGQPNGNNYVTMYKGYLLVPFASDDMEPQGGFQFWDVGNLEKPKAVFTRNDASTGTFVEVHGYGFTSVDGREYACFQDQYGIAIWDFTDVSDTKLVSKLKLPGIGDGGYNNGVFGVFWQHPYVYAAGSVQGVFVIDTKDVKNPKLVKQIPISSMGNFRVGNTFAIGNMLLASTVRGGNNRGLAFFDIGNPANPVMLSVPTTAAGDGFYSALINGNQLYLGGDEGEQSGSPSTLFIYELFDYPNIVLSGTIPNLKGTGEYQFVQDDNVIFGMEEIWYKATIKNGNYKILGEGYFPGTTYAGQQEGHPTPLGNVILLGDDHTRASGFFVHDVNPDNNPPKVNMVVPGNGSRNQALTSRIGVSFSDQVDIQSINNQTFVVRPQNGSPLKGFYSVQQYIANFSPEAPLSPNQVYEVVIQGVKDVSGNAMGEPFYAGFSTGSAAFTPPGTLTLKGSMLSVSAPGESGFQAANAADIDFGTYWRSPSGSLPLDIVLDLKSSMNVNRVNYYPRKSGSGGSITRYEVHVGTDATSWTKVAEGAWDDNLNTKYAEFSKVKGRYVKVVAMQGSGGYASASEFSVDAGNQNTTRVSKPAAGPAKTMRFQIQPFGSIPFENVGKPLQFELWDLSGEKLATWAPDNAFPLSSRFLNKGLYLIRLRGEKGTTLTKATFGK